MSSIDERVVELKFDNAQFEAGVQTSLGTLERLKRGLKLEGATQGLANVQAASRNFSLDNVAQSVDSLANRFSMLGTIGGRVLERLTDKALSMGKNILTAIPKQIFSGGINRAHNIEQAKFMLKGLGIAWEDVSKSIDHAVSGTRFGLDAAALAASQLSASGVQLGHDMNMALGAISGVAAMTNSSYEDISNVFTTVAGNGRLMGDQLRQLSTRGLNVAADLAKAFNTTEQEVREMVSKGQIDFMTFANTMHELYYEVATDANSTYSGVLSNVKASLSRMGESFATPFFDNLKLVLAALLPVMRDIEDQLIKPMAKSFTVFAEKTQVAAVKLLEALHGVIGVKKEVTDFGNVAKLTDRSLERIKKKTDDILGIQRKTTKETKETVEANEELEKIAKDVILGKYGNGEARRQALEAEGLSYERIQNKVNELLGVEKRWEVAEEELATTTEKTAKATKELAETPAEKLSHTLDGIGAALSIIANAGSALYKHILKPLATWGIKAILNGILTVTSALGKRLVNLNDVIQKNDIFNKGFSKIAKGFIGLKNGISGFFTTLSNLSGVKKLGETLGKLSTAISGLVKLGIDKIGEALSKVFDTIGKADASKFGGISTAIDRIATAISNFLESTILKLPMFESILNPFDKFEKKASGYKDSINKVLGVFKGTKETTESPFEKLKSSLKTFDEIQQKVGSITGAFTDPIGAVKNFFSSIYNAIANFKLPSLSNGLGSAKEFVNSLFGVPGDVVSEIISRGKSVYDTLTQTLSKIDFGLIFEGMKAGSMAYSFMNIGKFFKELTGGIESLKRIPDGISGALEAYTNVLKTQQKDIKANILLKIAGAIAILAASLIALSFVEPQKLWEVIKILGALAAGLVAVYAVISFINNKFSVGGKSSPLDPIAESLNGMMNAFKTFLKGAMFVEIGAGLMLIAGSLIVLVVALKMIAKLDVKGLSQHIEAFIAVFGALFLMSIAARVAGKGALGFGVAMMGLARAIDVMIGVLERLNEMKIDPGKMRRNLDALVEILVTMGVVIAAGTRIAGKGAVGFGVGLLAVAGSMMLAVEALKAIAEVPEDDISRATVVMDSVILCFSILTESLSHIKGLKLGTIIGLGAIIAALVLSLSYLSGIDATSLTTSAMALNSLMGVLAVLISTLQGLKLGNALTGALAIGLILAELVAALYGLQYFDISADLETIGSLSLMALSMSAVIFILQKVPWTAGFSAALALGEFILVIGGVLAGIGAAVTEWEGIAADIEAGIPIFESIGTAIGGFIGNLVGGFIGGALGAELPVLAQNLSQFGLLIAPFAQSMSIVGGMSDKITAGVGAIAGAIVSLEGAGIAQNNIFSKLLDGSLFGESKADENGFTGPLKSMLEMADALQAFSEKISEVSNFEQMTKAANAVTEIATAASTIPNEGGALADWIGDNTLGKWGQELISFAPALRIFGVIAGSGDYSGVGAAAEAVTTIAEAASHIPNQGGALADWMGDNTLSKWGAELVAFAPALIFFSSMVGSGDYSGVESAAKAVTQIAEAASKVPNQGGALADWIGDNTLAKWGAELVAFAPALKIFSSIVGNANFDNIDSASTAITSLAQAGATIQNEGGALAKLVGDNDFKTFAEGLQPLGEALAALSNSSEGISTESIDKAAKAVETLGGVGENIKGGLGGIFTDLFGGNQLKNLERFGEAMKNFGEGVNNLDLSNLTTLGNNIKTFADTVAEVSDFNSTSLFGLSQAVNSFAQEAGQIDAEMFAKGINSKRSSATKAARALVKAVSTVFMNQKATMKSAGTILGTYFANGISSKAEAASTAGKTLSSRARSGLSEGGFNSSYSLGQSFGDGYASGISSKSGKVYDYAKQLAKKAYEAVQKEQNSHSPSKKAEKLGGFFGEGYVIGVNSFAKRAAKAGRGLASSVADNLANPLKYINDIITGDLQTDPTIRPVMDLSGIQNGVKSINSMMPNTKLNVELASSGMSRSMSNRVSNSDIIDAINRMADREPAKSGDTYNINGVTYDDGSNISDAVRTLIRAARVERRA